MDLIRIVFTTLGSLVILFFLAKLMGNREISELSMFDYIISITIGSIAAEMATNLEEFEKPMIAMILYGLIATLISYLTCKSMKLRRFIEGQALLLYQDGKLYEKNMLKAKINISEFLEMCRADGYFNIEEIHTVFLEPNGKISILPMAIRRPVTPADLHLSPCQDLPMANVIIDGKLLKDNLNMTGKNEQWLKKQISAYGIQDIKEIMLATYDSNNESLNIYQKLHKEMRRDLFE